jgi:hypothetical protein
LYKTCPKCGHERAAGETGPEDVCGACGLIFSKYLKSRLAPRAPVATASAVEDGEAGWFARVKEMALDVPEEVDALYVYGRAALLAALIVYGVKLAAMDIPSWEMAGSLIHAPMVPFHEFGHIFFRPLGEFMTNLGGALFQAGLPLVLGGIFLARNRDPFAAAVMLWWFAIAAPAIPGRTISSTCSATSACSAALRPWAASRTGSASRSCLRHLPGERSWYGNNSGSGSDGSPASMGSERNFWTGATGCSARFRFILPHSSLGINLSQLARRRLTRMAPLTVSSAPAGTRQVMNSTLRRNRSAKATVMRGEVWIKGIIR